MPYQCARAVCATFCHHIAGALIPIFGPDFPSLCIPPGAPDHARMIIDSAIIGQSTREADYHRRVYSSMMPPAGAMSPAAVSRSIRCLFVRAQPLRARRGANHSIVRSSSSARPKLSTQPKQSACSTDSS